DRPSRTVTHGWATWPHPVGRLSLSAIVHVPDSSARTTRLSPGWLVNPPGSVYDAAYASLRSMKSNNPKGLVRLTVRRVRYRFWQPGGGYNRKITRSSTLRGMIEYLHGNPLRRGLVAKAEDWEWSTARWYAGLRPVPAEMDAMVMEELSRKGPPCAEG